MDIEPPALTALGTRQHGLISHRQVLEAGLTRAAWRHRLDTGAWLPVSSRVARRSGAPETVAQRLMALVLDAGPDAYVSHGSAAALWGLPGYRSEPPEVIVVRGSRDRRSQPRRP